MSIFIECYMTSPYFLKTSRMPRPLLKDEQKSMSTMKPMVSPPFLFFIKKILRDLPTSMPSLRHAWVPLPPAHFDETLPRTKVPFRDFLHGASFHGLLRI